MSQWKATMPSDAKETLRRFLETHNPDEEGLVPEFLAIREVLAQNGRLRAIETDMLLSLRGAERLADEVAALIQQGRIGSRSAAGDALLDYRNPPRNPRSDRIAELEAENEQLRAALKRIAHPDWKLPGYASEIAREALRGGDDPPKRTKKAS